MGAMDSRRRRRFPRALQTLARRVAPVALVAALGLGALGVSGNGSEAVGLPAVASSLAAAAGAVPAVGAGADVPAVSPASADGRSAQGRADRVADGELGVLIAPAGGGQLLPGGDLAVTVDIVNHTSAALELGEVVVSLGTATIDSRFELERWLEPAATGPGDALGVELLRSATPQVAAGEVATLDLVVPAAAIPLDATASFGPRALAVRFMQSGAEAAQGRSSVVFASTIDAAPTPLALVVPITPPPTSRGVIDAAELETLTAPGGHLAELLNAVEGTSATLAIDPRVLLSIRALSDEAPASASAWLDRLEGLGNASFELPYADADLTLQRQAGLEAPLALTSLDFALGPAQSVQPTASPSASPSDAGAATASPGADDETTASAEPSAAATSATDTPSPTADPESRPSYEELTAFDYTITGLAWPSTGTLGAGDLTGLTGWGYSSVLVDAGNIERHDDFSFTPAAGVDLEGVSAIAADSRLSDALALAAAATSVSDREAAVAEIGTVLAIVARELPAEPRALVATTGHLAASDPTALGAALRAINAMPWAAAGEVTVPDLTGDVPTASLRPGVHDQAVVDRVGELLTAEKRADAYATMFDSPELFRSERRADLLATLSSSWHEHLDDWIETSKGYLDYVTATEASVSVTESSDIQLVGRETLLPIFVRNDADRTVTVQVSLEPTTGRLEAGAPVLLRIEPGSMARAQVPVQAISNGNAVADVHVLTPDGVELSSTQQLRVNVQAEWETVTMIVAAIGLTVLFVWGIVRTVRRRHRERVVVSPSGEVTPDDEG